MLTDYPTAPLILLVEDDPGHAAAIQRSFEDASNDFRLKTAGSLHDARETIKQLRPALILTDYRLPDGYGSALTADAHGVCPVILMTSRGSEEIAVQSLKAGVQDYVVKSAETFEHMPETVNHSLKAWALILARKQTEETLRGYARRLIEIEEELRKKIATELHDEIGRDLTVLGMNFSIIKSALAQGASEKVSARLNDSAGLIEGISRTTRGIMAGLRPPVLDDYGLAAALRWHSDLFSSRTGISVTLHADELFPRLRPEVELALFRISQEALMNTAKHADAKKVTVTLTLENNTVLFTVADNGTGIKKPSSSRQPCTSWGITIMRERAELAGAAFTFDLTPGRGAVVTVTLPMEGV